MLMRVFIFPVLAVSIACGGTPNRSELADKIPFRFSASDGLDSCLNLYITEDDRARQLREVFLKGLEKEARGAAWAGDVSDTPCTPDQALKICDGVREGARMVAIAYTKRGLRHLGSKRFTLPPWQCRTPTNPDSAP